jgi:hypothetical protein
MISNSQLLFHLKKNTRLVIAIIEQINSSTLHNPGKNDPVDDITEAF